jgi:hypothetical protein
MEKKGLGILSFMKIVARPFPSVDHMINKPACCARGILGMAGLYHLGERDHKR